MTELTTYEQPATPTITTVGSEMIAATARALTDAHTIASALCRTTFVPKHFQGKPDDAAAAILYGASVDMDPLTALQNVFVISGKPSLYARTMVAIVLSKGHEVWTEEESDGSVTVAGRRKGSDKVERVTWTSAMAKRAGYESNAKYRTDSRSMLYARASGDVAKRIAPDALLGMSYNVEELQLAGLDHAPAAVQKSAGLAAVRAAVAPAQPDLPEDDDTEDAETVPDEPAETGEAVTDKTRGRLFALFAERGIEDRDEQLRGINHIASRQYESRADLTEADAQAVIGVLEAGVSNG